MIPRPADNANEKVILSTPLALVGMLVALIRERFKSENYSNPDVPWHWQEEHADTEIFVESGWNKNIEARNAHPGVWIDRDQNIYRTSSVGRQDQVSEVMKQDQRRYHSFGETDIVIDCVGRNRGESMLLGSIVQDFVQASAAIIEVCAGLRRISDVILNRTAPFDKDDKMWNSQINFRAYFEVRWGTIPVENLVNAIYARVEDRENPNDFFIELALRGEYPSP